MSDRIASWGFRLSAWVVIGLLFAILALLLKESVLAFKTISLREFFLGTDWNPAAWGEAKYGTLPLLVSSLMVTAGAMAIAVPWGILVAAFLSEVAGSHLRGLFKPVVELLATVPSVVYGFLGIVLVGPWVAKATGATSGLNALTASIILAVMILPTVISLADDAMHAVPWSWREASRALGATRWQTIWGVVVPAARPGIVAAVMLGFGRAVGETMAVLMAAGNARAMPHSFLDPVRTLTATIAIELGEVAWGSEHYHALFALGLYLFAISLLVNLAAEPFIRRVRR